MFKDLEKEIHNQGFTNFKVVEAIPHFVRYIKFEKNLFFTSIAANCHYGFVSVLDFIKLLSHIYEYNKADIVVTIDFDITAKQVKIILKQKDIER